MFGIILSVIVLLTMGYLILKNYKPQVVLAAAGIFLMICGVWLGYGALVAPEKSSGYLLVDIYNEILRMLSSRAAGLGLSIMAVGGYARYMDRMGASRAMVSLLSRPLKLIRSPYIVLAATYVIGQIMAQFITSASGLGMLLMVTLFPTLVSLGVSRLSAVAVIATSMSIEWGILETNSIFAAQVAGMKIATYFFHYQLPVATCVIIAVAIAHFFVQRQFDKKAAPENIGFTEQKVLEDVMPDRNVTVTAYYMDMIDLYKDSRTFRDSVMIGGIVTLIIALIGLLGYTSDETNRRGREIAIRKVNGATAWSILKMISKDISYIAIPAIVIGMTVAYYSGTGWLEKFTEKAPIGFFIFLAGAMMVYVLIIACVLYRAWAVSNSNPVDSLKSE